MRLDQHLAAAIAEFSEPRKAMMEIKRPMELAGLRSRLQRAQASEKSIAVTGKRYDAVLDQIDELHLVSGANVGQLETYAGELKSTIERMVGGSNGAPNDDGQDGQESGDKIVSDETIAAVETGQIADTAEPPPAPEGDAAPNADNVIPEVKP